MPQYEDLEFEIEVMELNKWHNIVIFQSGIKLFQFPLGGNNLKLQ